MKKGTIASAVVVLSLIIVCVVSITGSKLGSNEYGRMIAVTALYEEPATQSRYERVSYEDMENKLVSSAYTKADNPTTPAITATEESSVDDELADKNKAALMAIVAADQNSKAALAASRQEQYQINEIKEVDTSTSTTSALANAGTTTTYVLPQGNAAVNYTDAETPWTRIIEHKFFEFGDQPKTVISREFSSEWKPGDEPYYPVNDEKNGKLYEEYKKLADAEEKVVFGGRLGEYKYYDMDKVIESALNAATKELG